MIAHPTVPPQFCTDLKYIFLNLLKRIFFRRKLFVVKKTNQLFKWMLFEAKCRENYILLENFVTWPPYKLHRFV